MTKATEYYRIWAGEGERGTIEGHATTLRGARRVATRGACGGDRWARIERRVIVDNGRVEWERINATTGTGY